MNISSVLKIFRETLCAVETVHSYNMIHRDLKPGNVLLTNDNHVKLADFGLSKMLEDSLAESVFNEVVYYFPPETAMKKGYGKKGDVWQLGILL